MRKIGLFSVFASVFALSTSILFSGVGGKSLNNDLSNKNNLNDIQENNLSTDVITVGQMATFLQSKKAHYPLSDEFIERFQQTSGGYIDNAKKAGLTVNKYMHEPNQKWHFFDSWYYASLDDGSLTVDDSAKNRIYSKLLCPELLLWIYEACEVEPIKVKAAKEVAEEGKIKKTHISTIAKNMRSCVTWEDLEVNIQKYLNAN